MNDTHTQSPTLHGILLDIYHTGVLLMGPSGIGKSELGLELISRGHHLVADDAPEFRRCAGNWVEGYCPEILKNYIEIRDLGILDVRTLYGDTAIQASTRLQLIVNLAEMNSVHTEHLDRLVGSFHHHNVLGVDIAALTLGVSPTRNLSVLVETAVRHYRIKRGGYDPAQAFIERQQQLLEQK